MFFSFIIISGFCPLFWYVYIISHNTVDCQCFIIYVVLIFTFFQLFVLFNINFSRRQHLLRPYPQGLHGSGYSFKLVLYADKVLQLVILYLTVRAYLNETSWLFFMEFREEIISRIT